MNVHLAVILSLVPSFCLAQITFDAPIDLSTSVNGARGVYIEDMDGDGDNDILATGFIDDDLFWFENLNGTGTFSAKIQISPSGSLNGCWTASAGDMNGDGHMDAVAAAYSDDKAVWYAGDGW